MAKALVNKIGCGTGKLYAVKAATGVTIMVDDNDFNGVKQMRQLGIVASPLAAARSAVGTITIMQVDGGGDFSDVTVNGVSILGTPYTVTTTDEVFEANGLAAAINAYTPLSGPKYFAVSDGNIISLQAPENDAQDYNNYVIVVTVSVVSIETEVTDFDGGSDNNGVFDTDFGLQFYLDNNVSATNEINGTDAIDVTSIFAMRGLQTGIYTDDDVDITDDTITIERKSAITSLILSPESGSDDVLVTINPSGFIAGDILILRTIDLSTFVSVESMLTSASTKEPKNIILTSFGKCRVSGISALLLQYQYSEEFGRGIFTELVRTDTPLLIEVDYDFLVGLVDDGLLIPGMKYAIVSGKEYDEVLVLTATSNSTLDMNVMSREFPTDLITYDFDNDEVIFRHDTVKNLSARWDWRNKKQIVYKRVIDVSAVSFPCTPTEWSYGGIPFVLDNDGELVSIVDLRNWLAFITGCLGFNSGNEVHLYSTYDFTNYDYYEVDDGGTVTLGPGEFTDSNFEAYTFGNSIYSQEFDGTPVFESAADGNGGNCYDILITSKTDYPIILGDYCFDLKLQISAGAILSNTVSASIIAASFAYLYEQASRINFTAGSSSLFGCGGSWGNLVSPNLDAYQCMGNITNYDSYSLNYKSNAIPGVVVADTILRLYDRITSFAISGSATYEYSGSQTVTKIYTNPIGNDGCPGFKKIQPLEGETLVLTPTAFGSLANDGEIVASGTITLVGDNQDYAIIEQFSLGGAYYWRVLEYHNFT